MTALAAGNARGSTAAWWTLFVLTLRQYLHGKRWLLLTLLFLLPAGLAMLVRWTNPRSHGNEMEFVFIFMLIPQALLPLSALIYASGMIQDEQEEQTITYLLVRPISKSAIYLVKLAGTLLTAVALTTAFTALTFAAIYVKRPEANQAIVMRCITTAGIHSLAVVCYCCLFGLLSMVTRRILIAGIVYIGLVEGLLANLNFGIRLITVIYYTRIIAYRSLSFLLVAPARTEDMAADTWNIDTQNDPNLTLHPQLSTCIIVLVAASLISAALAAYICRRREFHVKTPEKN